MTKPVREHTILFTESCPLACVYCNLKTDSVYGTNNDLTEEEINAMLEEFAQDDEELYETRIVFTGGEPFLAWDMIKRAITKYGNRFSYLFNTSGYLFTREILQFLRQYRVDFNLSVDGPSYITDKIRPTVSKNAEPYFSHVEKIFPDLLYFYPLVTWKTIIMKDFIDEIFNIYLTAEQIGFKRIHFILDFLSGEWDDREKERLQEQFYKIIAHMILRFENNQDILQVRGIEDFLYTVLFHDEVHPDNLICQVFNGRSLSTLNSPEHTFCMAKDFTMQECKEKMLAELKETPYCPHDKECGFFKYCANYSCPKNSYEDYGVFYRPRDIECILARIIGNSSIALLQYGNVNLQNSQLWLKFIERVQRRGF